MIVDLGVPWEPESKLAPDAAAAQRARIELAQDEVIRTLGSHGQLDRRLTATAQMAVSVDAQGRALLAGHPRVASIHDDMAKPPAGSS